MERFLVEEWMLIRVYPVVVRVGEELDIRHAHCLVAPTTVDIGDVRSGAILVCPLDVTCVYLGAPHQFSSVAFDTQERPLAGRKCPA